MHIYVYICIYIYIYTYIYICIKVNHYKETTRFLTFLTPLNY